MKVIFVIQRVGLNLSPQIHVSKKYNFIFPYHSWISILRAHACDLVAEA